MTRGFSLARLLSPERVTLPLEAGDKEGIIRELAGVLTRSVGAADRSEELAEAVLEREAVLSTGIGGGVALPHARTTVVSELLLAAGTTTPGGVDFEALDGRPVRLVFMLAGPVESAGDHVKALSRLSRLLARSELRRSLAECTDADEFLAVLREAEAG